MEKIRIYAQIICETFKVLAENYHCCEADPKTKSQAVKKALLLFFISGISFALFYVNRRNIDSFFVILMVAVYFSILSFSWGAYTLIEYGYKHSQRNHRPVTQMTIIVLCYILYGIYILISVPATIVTYIFSKVISYRAKRIQNFDDVRQIVLYNYITVVLIIAIEQKLLLVHKATEWIGLRIRLNQYAADLFLLMGIMVGIIRTCNYFVLENQYRRGKKKVKDEVTQEKENVVSREIIKKE